MILNERFQNLAFKYYSNREFDKALRLLDRLLEEDKDNFNLLLFKGDILFEKEEIESAQNYYISALEKANKEKNHFKRLLSLMKLKRIQGETNELNSRIFLSAYYLGILKLCKDSLYKLLREEVIDDSKKYLERIIKELFNNTPTQAFLLGVLNIYLKNDEGLKLLNSAFENIDFDERLRNYKELIKKFIYVETKPSLSELEDILKIEGLSEKKLEPSGTVELADLLKSIGSLEEAILEYYSSIYGYLKSESNIEKAREVLNKIKEISPQEERLTKVEEFLDKFESTKVETGKLPEITHEILLKIYEEFLLPENSFENYITFLNLMAEWNMHEDVINDYKEIEDSVSVDLFAPYYLYTLYLTGEYEEVISKSDKFIEATESEEILKFIKYFKALSLYNLNNRKEALEIFGSIYEQDPGFLDVKEYLEIKRPEEALVSESVLEEEKELTAHEKTIEIPEILTPEVEEKEAVIEEIGEVYEEKEIPEMEQVKLSKKVIKEHFIIL